MSFSNCVRSIAIGFVALTLAAAWPRAVEAQAQPRAPVHRGPSSPVIVGGTWGPRYVFHGGYYPWGGWGYPYGWGHPFAWGYPIGWGYPFAFGFGFSWGAPYGFHSPYPAYGYAPYAYAGYSYDASIRVDVSQVDAEVFVDGYRAGVVDDFDGVFQRLRLAPGGHEITIYRPGFQTIKESLYLSPGGSRTLRYTMTPLGPGETAELPAPPSVTTRGPRDPNDQGAPPKHLTEHDRRVPQDRPQPPAREAVVRFGSLALAIQPSDAEIFIDGEKWAATTAATERTIIKLSEGRHKIEVRKAGFSTYTETVLIRDGATLTLNVVLSR